MNADTYRAAHSALSQELEAATDWRRRPGVRNLSEQEMNADAYRAAHSALSQELEAATASLSGAASLALMPLWTQFRALPSPDSLQVYSTYWDGHPSGHTYSSATQTAEGIRQQLRTAIGTATTPRATTTTRTTSAVRSSTAPPERPTMRPLFEPAPTTPDALTAPPTMPQASAGPMSCSSRLMIAGLAAIGVGLYLWSRKK